MNRIKTLMTSILASVANTERLQAAFGDARLSEIASGTVKLSAAEANQIASLPDTFLSPELVQQMNTDDLATVPQSPKAPKKTQTSKSPSTSMRGQTIPRHDW